MAIFRRSSAEEVRTKHDVREARLRLKGAKIRYSEARLDEERRRSETRIKKREGRGQLRGSPTDSSPRKEGWGGEWRRWHAEKHSRGHHSGPCDGDCRRALKNHGHRR